jgi:hypothetical protein
MAGAGGRSSFGGRSKIWLRLVQSLVSSFVVMTWMGPAQADTSYDPSGERMAWTDRFTTSDIQARVWLLTNGGGVAGPGRYLMTKATDVAIGGWVGAGLTGLDTGLDAVSWPDGTNQRERVFYVASGQIYMLTFDNESFGSKTDCVSCALGAFGVTIQNTDLAAITFVDGVRRMAVAAGCTSQTSSIQYHCHRGNWFMGEYRDSKVFGNRAYMNYQSGGTLTTPYTYRGRWISRWSLTTF